MKYERENWKGYECHGHIYTVTYVEMDHENILSWFY